MLESDFFDQTALRLAQALIGKVLRHRVEGTWLSARIIETEAYYRRERGSHASLGETPSRRALFMDPGTIYMYYARGGDSLNVSARGAGNAVLIKSAFPYFDAKSPRSSALPRMQALYPNPDGTPRPVDKLCRGQTLACKALGLRVPDWTTKTFDPERFFIEDVGYQPRAFVRARRLGIPAGRDEHLMYRFIDEAELAHCTSNPTTKRDARAPRDYRIVKNG